MKQPTLTAQANAWNAARLARSRVLTDEEAAAFERARQTLHAELPPQLLELPLLRGALASLRIRNQIRVKNGPGPNPGKNEFGITSLLEPEVLIQGDDALFVAMLKVACAFGVRRKIAAALHLRPESMDYFAEEFHAHGYLPGRAAQLAGWMLAKANVHLYLQKTGIGARLASAPPPGKHWMEQGTTYKVDVFQNRVTEDHRAHVYAVAVVNAKPNYRVRYPAKSVSEEAIWRLIFGQVGARFYQLEVRQSSDRRNRPSERRRRASGSAYLQ